MRSACLLFALLLASSHASHLKRQVSPRIAGTILAAAAGKFPEVVHIWPDGAAYGCVGSILAANLSITAASCFWDNATLGFVDTTKAVVTAGQIDNTVADATPNLILSVIYHPEFRYLPVQKIFENDVALVVPTTSFSFSDSVKAIYLGKKSSVGNPDAYLSAGTTIAGWGMITDPAGTEAGLAAADALLKWANVTVLKHENCRIEYASKGKAYKLPSNTICTKVSSSTGYCGGEPGIGLRYKSKTDGKSYLIGVGGNLKSGKCPPLNSNIYAYVPDLAAWIRANGGPVQP